MLETIQDQNQTPVPPKKSSFTQLLFSLSPRKTRGLVITFLLLLVVPVTLIALYQRQELRQHAAETDSLIADNPYGVTAGAGAAITPLGVNWVYTWHNTSAHYTPTHPENFHNLALVRLGGFWWDRDQQKTRYNVELYPFQFKDGVDALSARREINLGSYIYAYNEDNIRHYLTVIAQKAQGQATSHYYVLGNEVNFSAVDGDGNPPADLPPDKRYEFYAWQYKILAELIHQIDPQAQLVAPSVLTEFKEQQGQEWLTSFISTYQRLFRQAPPIDILNFHAYDGIQMYQEFDATGTVQYDGVVQRVMNNLTAYRAWADSYPFLSGKPIFITEFGVLNYGVTPGWKEENKNRIIPIAQEVVRRLALAFQAQKDTLGLKAWMVYSGSPSIHPLQFGTAQALSASGTDYHNMALAWQSVATPVPPIPTATPAPTNTPTPVVIPPTATPTPRPIVPPNTPVPPTHVPTTMPTTPPVQVTATPTLAPTATPAPNQTVLAFTVFLHGIGASGDSQTSTGGGNKTPLHAKRQVTLQVYVLSDTQKLLELSGTAVYNSAIGIFQGSIATSSLPSGTYVIKLKEPQYLQKAAIATITANQVNTFPVYTLIAGDVTNDNKLDLLDYNIIRGCLSVLEPAQSCTPEQKLVSDINDDGKVDVTDRTLFIRELTSRQGD